MTLRAPRLWIGIAALLAVALPCGAAPTVVELDLVQRKLLRRSSPRFLVCGHRGAYFEKPNNTPQSIEKALRAGAELIEIDIETTAEHKCVVAHDSWPRANTLANWRKQGKTLPTLEECIRHIGNRAVIVLDIKTPHLHAVVNDVRRLKADGRCVFYTPRYHELRKLHKTCYVMVRARNSSDVQVFARNPDKNIVIVHGDYKWLKRSDIALARRSGRRVFANSYKLDPLFEERHGASKTAARLFRRGIGIVQTNHVASAVNAKRRFIRR